MLSFQLFWAVTSTDSYSSMTYNQKKLYVRSSCPSKRLKITDTGEYDVVYISVILFYLSTGKYLIKV